MQPNILDEPDAYSGPRVCPRCGHQYPYGRFVLRYVMAYGLGREHCPGCAARVEYDSVKIQVFWLIALVGSMLLLASLLPHFDRLVLGVAYVVANFVFILGSLYYVEFRVAPHSP